MPRSMTGFSHHETVADGFHITWRLKSVNHRYLDLAFRLPDGLEELEIRATKTLKTLFSRGHLDCTLILTPVAEAKPPSELNVPLVKNLFQLERKLLELDTNPDIGPQRAKLDTGRLLAWPGMVQRHNPLQGLADGKGSFFQSLLTSLEKTAHLLNDVRTGEGRELEKIIQRFLHGFRDLLDQIEDRLPKIRENLQRRVRDRVEMIADGMVDKEKLAQELAFLLNRMDVTEEMDRLKIHLGEMTATLDKEEPIGRRLDFLCQEMNREANTLCSKAQDGEVSRIGVEMKVIVEKLREQVQNLE